MDGWMDGGGGYSINVKKHFFSAKFRIFTQFFGMLRKPAFLDEIIK
jgi:hypothetical protein